MATSGYIWLQAVIDGRVLPRAPAVLLAEAAQAKVPLLIGSVVQELEYGGKQGAQARLRRDYPAQADAVLQVQRAHGAQRAARQGDAAMQLSTDLTFRCPAVTVAQHQAALGVPVWHYVLDAAAPGGPVTHSAELPFLIKDLPIGQPPVSLQRYWAAFVQRSGPTCQRLARLACVRAQACSIAVRRPWRAPPPGRPPARVCRRGLAVRDRAHCKRARDQLNSTWAARPAEVEATILHFRRQAGSRDASAQGIRIAVTGHCQRVAGRLRHDQ